MSSRAPRIAQVEGLRAVAAGAVFLTHLGQTSGFTSQNPLGPLFARLNVGVTIFFVITGYLLYRPWVVARIAGRPRPRLGRYAARRAARILPAYWVALVALALILPSVVEGVFSNDWWAYFGLLQVYSRDWILNGLTVAWSLGTEVAFYALLPALGYVGVRVLGRRGRHDQVRIELWALACSAVVALALLEVAHRADWGQMYPITLLGKWPWFAVGMALGVANAAWAHEEWAGAPRLLRSARAHPWAWWSCAALVLVFSALEAVLPREVFAMDYRDVMLETALYAVFAALLVTPVIVGEASAARSPARLLSVRPVVWLGTVSYGIFLWHRPFVLWTVGHYPTASLAVLGLLSLALTLACAAASWYLVERPVMAVAHRGTASRPATSR